jgi:hypothetical protein
MPLLVKDDPRPGNASGFRPIKVTGAIDLRNQDGTHERAVGFENPFLL